MKRYLPLALCLTMACSPALSLNRAASVLERGSKIAMIALDAQATAISAAVEARVEHCKALEPMSLPERRACMGRLAEMANEVEAIMRIVLAYQDDAATLVEALRALAAIAAELEALKR